MDKGASSLQNLKDDAESSRRVCFEWLFSPDSSPQEEVLERYLMMATTDNDAWYGSGLLPGLVEDCEAYRHYAQCCQGISMDPFNQNVDKEEEYRHASMDDIDVKDETVMSDLEHALNQYYEIGRDLGIHVSNKSTFKDPSNLTQWILCGSTVCEIDL
eukprot:c27924_g2_i2 orf=65-538(-)